MLKGLNMYKHLLEYYLRDEGKAHLTRCQILALEEVYKGLYYAWEAYSQTNIEEEGPFKDACIFYYMNFPVFGDKKFPVVFFHEYSLHDVEAVDQVKHRLLYAMDEFIDPWLMDLFGGLYFHHNDIKPSQFKKLFQNKIIERIG